MGGIKVAPSEEEDGGPLTPDTAVLSAAASGESSPVGTTSSDNDPTPDANEKEADTMTVPQDGTSSAIPTTPGQHRTDAPLTVLTRKEFRSYACNVLGASEKELPKPWMEEKQAGEEEKGRR